MDWKTAEDVSCLMDERCKNLLSSSAVGEGGDASSAEPVDLASVGDYGVERRQR